jgi:hypothetical protein
LLPDTLDDIGAHGATPEALPLRASAGQSGLNPLAFVAVPPNFNSRRPL